MKIRYLLDSNVLMDFFKKRSHATALINELKTEGKLAISAISLMELQAGWTDHQAEKFFPILLDAVKVKKVTDELLHYAGKLRRDYRKKGILLQSIDTLIAATAIQHDLTMVTYNTRHFKPIKELELYEEK